MNVLLKLIFEIVGPLSFKDKGSRVIELSE